MSGSESHSDPVRLALSGPLTMNSVGKCYHGLAIPLTTTDIRIDLSGVTDVDSSAVALLTTLIRQTEAKGSRVHLESLPQSIFDIAGIYDVGALLAERC
ncbi:MAG: lipid asymmetry maintenance protein MlaB [Hyphomicrobiales bacterium]